VADGSEQARREATLQTIIRDTLSLDESTSRESRSAYRIIKLVFDPHVSGHSNLPDEPVLFVGNHTMYALDAMLMPMIMQHEFGRFVRGMADRLFFFGDERLRNLIIKMGAVAGDPAVCTALMEAGKDLLVFPGGAREVTKTAEERYRLKWKKRDGFIRLAAKNGYTIVPFPTVGTDELYDRYMEGHEIPDSALGRFLQRIGLLDENVNPDYLPPIPKGLFGSLWPKPQRCYLGFGEPLRLAQYEGCVPDDAVVKELRDEVAGRIESQISQLLLKRTQHHEKDGWLRRVLTR